MPADAEQISHTFDEISVSISVILVMRICWMWCGVQCGLALWFATRVTSVCAMVILSRISCEWASQIFWHCSATDFRPRLVMLILMVSLQSLARMLRSLSNVVAFVVVWEINIAE